MTDEYPNEPRLRDLPVTIWNMPRLAILSLISGLSNHCLAHLAFKYLPFLSDLFALWLSSSLQIWRDQGLMDGSLARLAL